VPFFHPFAPRNTVAARPEGCAYNAWVLASQHESPGDIMSSRLDISDSRTYIEMESELDMAETITNRVKELRGERGWTQQQLAAAVGVSRQSVNSIERNRYVPSLPLALKFAAVFERPTDEIFTLED
jgi:putative transcriptional regulator